MAIEMRPGGLVVRAARMFDGRRWSENAAVLIEGGRITAAGPAGDIVPTDRSTRTSAEVMDLGDRTLLPGLIDGHAHLSFSGDADVIGQMCHDDAALLLMRAVANAEIALRTGITTVRDCGDRGNITLILRDAIASGIIRGPRLICCGMPITSTAGHCHFLGLEADTDDDLIRAVRGQVKAGVDGIKIMATGGRLTPGTNPDAPQYTVGQLAAVVADAHRLGRRVAAHALATEGIRRAVEAGVDTIEHLSWLKSGNERDYDDKIVDQMIAKRLWGSVTNAHSPQEHLYMLGKTDDLTIDQRSDMEIYEVQLGLIDSMYRAGLPMMITDDAGCPDVPIAAFPLALASLSARTSIPPAMAITMATASAAEALGLEVEVGTIEVSKWADLLAVDGDPTEDATDLARTAFVFKQGRLVCAENRLL